MAALFNLRSFLFAAIFLLSILLNFYQLPKNPPGLYIDEVAIGVNAYSILTKGEDEYGAKYPLYFKSYGDYKLPVYIYLTSVSMAIFGKNEFAVRFPSVFFGVLTLVPFFLIVRKLSKNKTLPLLATFLLSVSPWFMHFVGPAFEATVGLFFFMLGIYLYILFKEKKRYQYLFISLLSFIFTIITYNSYKLITPLVFILIIYDLIKANRANSAKKFQLFATILLILAVFFAAYFSNPSNTRFMQTSAFSTPSFNNVLIFLKNYLSYFSFDFLYINGDGINRHQFLNFGILSRWTLPFLLLGFYKLLKDRNLLLKNFTFGLLLVAPMPAALALPSPHTLRSLLMIVPFSLIISFGGLFFINKSQKYTKPILLALVCIFLYEFSIYLHFSYFHYPKTALIDWGGNYKEVVQKATQLSTKYPYLVVDERLTYAPVYFRFYNEEIKFTSIKSGWTKEKLFGNQPLLLISIAADTPSDQLVETVYLPNDNKDIFVQFWEI